MFKGLRKGIGWATKKDALENIEGYLSDKYQEEFEITELEFKNHHRSYYPYKRFSGKARCLRDKELGFKFDLDPKGNVVGDDLMNVWMERRFKEELKAKVGEKIPESHRLETFVNTYGFVSERKGLPSKENSDRQQSVNDYMKIEKDKGHVPGYRVFFFIRTENSVDKEKEEKRIWDLSKWLETNYIAVAMDIRFVYVRPEKWGEIQKRSVDSMYSDILLESKEYCHEIVYVEKQGLDETESLAMEYEELDE